jgi:hypothetical protein
MAVHGLDGDIVQGNTFYDDKHELVGKCDFVMANPPFNALSYLNYIPYSIPFLSIMIISVITLPHAIVMNIFYNE